MAKGSVVQVIGTVVDVEFPPDELPALYNALTLDNNGEKLVLEVEQHVGNNWVRCLALGPTEGLARGVEAEDSGSAILVPVGPETLGRLFDVTGGPSRQPWSGGGTGTVADPPSAAVFRRAVKHPGGAGDRD